MMEINQMNPVLASGNEQRFERVLAASPSLAWIDSNSCGSGAILKDDYILDSSKSKSNQAHNTGIATY